MSVIPIQEVIPAKSAATLLGLSEQRVRTLLRSGAIEGRQVGKQWITTVAAVSTFKNSGAVLPPEDRARAGAIT